jgi:phosphatidylglycerol lysyltransferase
MNGILAILLSLAHIHLLGRLKGLYFAGDTAWLAQHGVIIGIIMLYLSRHLARGEARARQILLLITGLETIKYSVIAPHAVLMVLYMATFLVLFVLRDTFNRGVIPLTWDLRRKDLYTLLAGISIAAVLALLLLDRDGRIAVISNRAFEHLTDFATHSYFGSHVHARSVLLAHTVSVFLVSAVVAVLYVLFRPYPHSIDADNDDLKIDAALKKYANSSEDYFKLWPQDKRYFWSDEDDGFIAYKVTGSTAFALPDPIAENRQELLIRFIEWCKARRLRVCFLPVTTQSRQLYADAGLNTIQIGSSAVVSLQEFLETTARDKWWRWQKNRALKLGYVYEVSYPPHDSAFMRQIRAVSDSWLDFGGHKERGFAMGYFDDQYLQHCPIHHLLTEDGSIAAFTNQLPSYHQSQTVTIDLLRYAADANNAMPYLLLKMIESVSRPGSEYEYFDCGFVPFAQANDPILRIAKAASAGRFSAKGLEQFKNKFNPDWQPNYMAYEGDLADLASIALNLEQVMEKAAER